MFFPGKVNGLQEDRQPLKKRQKLHFSFFLTINFYFPALNQEIMFSDPILYPFSDSLFNFFLFFLVQSLGCVSSDFLSKVHAVPATVLWVALPDCLLQLNVEERQLLPALLLLYLVKYGCVKVIHGVSSFQQEVVSHGLKVLQEPEETRRVTGDADGEDKNRHRTRA